MSWWKNMFSNKDARNAQMQQEALAAAAQQQQAELSARFAAQQQEQMRLNQMSALQFAQQREEQARALAKATEEAQAAQRAAEEANYRASLGPADSNDARTAQERLLRRMAGRKGVAAGLQGAVMGAAPTAEKTLMGA